MRIQCPSCKQIVATTTEKFNPGGRPNGSMLEIAEPYKSRGWGQVMAWTIATQCSEIFCPLCNYPLAPSGHFTLLGEPEIVEQMPAVETEKDIYMEPCPKCGKVEGEFKNRSGFVNHCRKCPGIVNND